MINLKEVNFGINQYCGPAVMSALTGKSTDECASIIMSITGRAEVRAVNIDNLILAFKKLRFNMEPLGRFGYTLFANLSSLSVKPGMYIIIVPKHVVAVEVTQDKQLYLVDNHSKQPLLAESSARLSQRCEQVYKITELPQPVFLRTDIEIKRGYASNIYINAYDRYENADDIQRRLGQIMYKDDGELSLIIDELRKLQ